MRKRVGLTIKSLTDNRLKAFLTFFEVKRDLKLICVWEFVFCFGDGLFYFVLPVYMNQLNATPVEVGMLYGVHYLSWGITLMIGGFLADHFDQKKIMILGSLIWIPVPIMLAAATSWNQLWLPMILYGTYFGSASTCVYVLKSAPPERTMQTFGLWSASVALGYLVSPMLGGFISSAVGKQTVFLIATVFYAVSVLPLFLVSRLPKPEIKESQTVTKRSSADFALSRNLIVLCVFFAMIIFAIYLVSPLIPQFTNGVYNQTIFNLGIFGTATSFGWIFFSFALGKIGDKRSKMTAVLTSMIVCSFAFLLIAMINNFTFLCFASFLSGASQPIIGFIPAIIGSAAPERRIGRWISVSQTGIYIASFGAPIVGGLLYEFSPYLAFFTTISLLSFLAVVATLKL